MRRHFPLLLGVLVAFLLAMPARSIAQSEVRVPPINDDLIGRLPLLLPFSQSSLSVSDATIEANEQDPPCIRSGVSKSVWYQMIAPAGVTLAINTAGSNYDTVVAVWTALGNPTHTSLINVACKHDASKPALLKYAVPAGGMYIVSISALAGTGFESLDVSFDFEVPAAKIPAGSSPAAAVPLKINAATTVKNIEYAVHHSPVVGAPVCGVGLFSYPVWFQLTVSHPMRFSFSTEGSTFNVVNFNPDTDYAIDVFPSGFLAAGDSVGCDDDSGYLGAGHIDPTLLLPGIYYVRVMVDTIANASSASRVRVTTRLANSEELLVNSDFSSPTLGWTVKNGTGDGISAGMFVFTGGPNESSQLQQKVTFSPPLPVDDNINTYFQINSSATVMGQPFTIALTFTYTDGTVITDKRSPQTMSGFHTITTQLTKKSLKSIKLAMKYKGTSGSFVLDNAILKLWGVSARDAAPAALPLPLPPAR